MSGATRATKAEVNGLARRIGLYSGARRSFTTDWVVELFDATSSRVVRDARNPVLAVAYGELATWLRAKAAA